MPRSRQTYYAFNRGLVSPLGLARQDLERTQMSAETMTNFTPRRLGSMMLRPGTAYILNTLSDRKARYIPFVFAADDKALLEITAGGGTRSLRPIVNDAVITIPSVSTAVSNGDFASLTNWTDNDTVGGISSNPTTGGTAYLSLSVVVSTGAAIRTQQVTVAGGDQGVEHFLVVQVGNVDPTASDYVAGAKLPVLRVGSTAGDDDYVNESLLDVGVHYLSFTPTGDFHIQLENRQKGVAYVQDCNIAAAGTLTITTPWAAADLSKITYDQSGDVVYIAADGYRPKKIERRSARSWSVVDYQPQDGPLQSINAGNVSITPAQGAVTGTVQLTTDIDIFRTTDEGSVIRLDGVNQVAFADTVVESVFTSSIEVGGVFKERIFTLAIAGTFSATVTLQRSFETEDGPWEDVTTFVAASTTTYDDALDSQTVWYRAGIKSGDFTSGSASITITHGNRGKPSYLLVQSVTSNTAAPITVLFNRYFTDAETVFWYWGAWGTRFGYPAAVSFVQGRLAWVGKNKAWLSASDAYETFEIDTEGDSGPITRTIGKAGGETITWAAGETNLIIGTASGEYVLRSSNDDGILTPTSAKPDKISDYGGKRVMAQGFGESALWVQRGGFRLMQSGPDERGRYVTNDLTVENPDIGSPGFTHIAVQRLPETRVHCVRSDGTVGILVYDPVEQVSCWLNYTVPGTSALVEDIVVLPGDDGEGEDHVYYITSRTVDGSTVRFLEKFSLESECQGGSLNKQVDAHITGTVSSGTLTGLSHLEGETVAVWVNGVDAGTYTVTSSQITGVTSDGSAVAGLSYTAQFKSSKLSRITGKANVSRLGLVLYNTHYLGLTYGPDFSNLDNLPLYKDGALVADDTIHSSFDEESMSLDGTWDADARVCLQAQSPRPCTILAAVMETESG